MCKKCILKTRSHSKMGLNISPEFTSRKLLVIITLILLDIDANGDSRQVHAFEESCFENATPSNTTCSDKGHLKMRFCPYTQTQLTTTKLNAINCSTNQPAELTLTLNNKPLPARLKVTSHSCYKRIEYEGQLSFCFNGTYRCIAKNQSGAVLTKNVNVTIFPFMKLTFEVEKTIAEQPNKFILGTTMNLTCTVKGRGLKPGVYEPMFEFLSLDESGREKDILESYKLPKKFLYAHVETQLDGKYSFVFTRKLQVARISQNDSSRYKCVVHSDLGHCSRSKIIKVTTRVCRVGHYCLAGSSYERPCPGGTYSNTTGIFNASSCKKCGRGFYCPEGSTMQFLCPNVSYSNVDPTITFPLQPATSRMDCNRCPMKQSCDKTYTCKFICGTPNVTAKTGESAELKCKLLKQWPSLLKNLRWKRGKSYISGNDKYDIFTRGAYSYLAIQHVESADAGKYRCEGTETWRDTLVHEEVSLNVLSSDEDETNYLYLWIVGSAVLLFIIGLGGWLLIKRFKLQQDEYSSSSENNCHSHLFNVNVKEEYGPDSQRALHSAPVDVEYEYDVFICYSSQDKTWVRKTLLPTLQDHNLQVCIDYKDFAPGSHIIKNISDAIDRSRKTIAVLSPDYVVSAWCNEELQMALGRIEDRHQVIPLMYRMCKVPNFLHHRTYLDWCNPDIKPMFWEQLIKAIDDGKSIAESYVVQTQDFREHDQFFISTEVKDGEENWKQSETL